MSFAAGARNTAAGVSGVTASSQRAIFCVFVCLHGAINTAFSVSNVLAAPLSIGDVFKERFPNTDGTLEFYLWDHEANLTFYETDASSPGIGLSPTGTLGPGKTYRVLLSEILAAAGYKGTTFAGYAWVVANFDGVQGTANVTDFSTFTQATVMQPDIGSSFFDFDANAGIPIMPPRD